MSARCDSCNSNVDGERVVCWGCHEAILTDASAPPATFAPCPDYTPGQSHPECPKGGGFGAVVAPAPLAAAIEEARHWLSRFDAAVPTIRPGSLDPSEVRILRRLLLALGADDRLAKAEAALRRVEAQETAVDGLRPELYGHAVCIARRYFAQKGAPE